MPELNQFAISRALGSTMAAAETPRFGRFGLLPLVASSRPPAPPIVTPGCLEDQYDTEIKKAFATVAEGKSPDRMLADPALAQKFVRTAKKLGVEAEAVLINRRLLRLRKKGGRLPKATEKVPQSSLDPHNAFAIEYGVVRIAHLYGATVDDILCEPSLGKEYQKIVEALAPGYTALVYRLGALYLRKTRNLKKATKHVIEDLDPSDIERSWVDLGSVNGVRKSRLIEIGAGILDLDEGDRSLYVSKTGPNGELASTFLGHRIWDAMGNHFWHPDTSRIHMKVLPQSALGDQVASWELRLIQSLEPIFNIKVDKDAA